MEKHFNSTLTFFKYFVSIISIIIILGLINIYYVMEMTMDIKMFVLPFLFGSLISFFATKISSLNHKYLLEKEIVSKSLKEKEILLKEVHHRVKNNLQIITSLLGLQSNFIDNKKIKNLFQQCQYRINSMALVHETLYQNENFESIHIKGYIKKLTDILIASMRGLNHNFNLVIEAENLQLNIDSIVPLGLIINECITNSLKYGYKDKKEGALYIKIKELDDNKFSLCIGDYGSGYSNDINLKSSKSLGLKIIHNLSIQLSGTITKDKSKKGTHYELIFEEINS